jgi:hypothetical protein
MAMPVRHMCIAAPRVCHFSGLGALGLVRSLLVVALRCAPDAGVAAACIPT